MNNVIINYILKCYDNISTIRGGRLEIKQKLNLQYECHVKTTLFSNIV